MNLCLHIFIPRGVRFLEEMRSRHPRIQFWSQLVDQGWLRGIANTRQECSFHCPHYCAPQKASLLNLASNLRKRISGKINKAVSYCPIATYAYTIIYICHHMPHHHLHENLWQVNVANISQKPRDKKILIPYHDVPRGRLKEGIGPIHEGPQQWQHPKHGPLTCHAIAWQTVPTGAVRQKAGWISRICFPRMACVHTQGSPLTDRCASPTLLTILGPWNRVDLQFTPGTHQVACRWFFGIQLVWISQWYMVLSWAFRLKKRFSGKFWYCFNCPVLQASISPHTHT